MTADFDVLVVGGGIIGASAGQHMASAGYKTLLVEKGDYASETSSRTSRMHNCGFMYFLDAYDSPLRLVLQPRSLFKSLELARRTMCERASFVRTSPDRVRKIDFFIPFQADGKTTRFRMKIAATLLRLLGGRSVSLEPTFLNASSARRHPLLQKMNNSQRLSGAFRFAEYQYAWPERIVVDTILKGRVAGLDARNYTTLVALSRDAGIWSATLEHEGTNFTVTAKAIVNAAGAWVDHITRLASNSAPDLNTGVKGVNLLVQLPPEMKGMGMETVTARGAPFYMMPWGDMHYMGPADAPADAATTEFRATDAEILEILKEANRLFPTLHLGPEDVLYSWAGVRPRTASMGKPFGSLEVREHDLTAYGLENFFVFTGGLIMTHRDAGRRLLKAVQRHISPSGKPSVPDYHLSRQPDEDRVSATSVARAINQEQARSLSDILRRRLSVGWSPDLGLSSVEEAADFAGPILNWSPDERAKQVACYRAEVERSFRPRSSISRSGLAEQPLART
ncbi:FAD-dependent oxidoreductase [Mesorhizobium sp.]|uniref:FAD-dependent oxidoreductase n=1 Tax=Mesorhizobium sp. TaxID=1871066 RepID=UPI000FE69A1C|nr:FAD-dependent oxidoreductase [Mesorhizobium sp.]RWB69979.1 MAG: FAD-dependent oxidoreductase [Mesorhizobium sp.]